MRIKMQALQDSINRLNAIGATFKIITHDGKEYGTLKVAPPAVEKTSRPQYLPLYREKLDALKVGDVIELDAGKIAPEKIRTIALAHLIKRHKPGCATSFVNGSKIEILRIR